MTSGPWNRRVITVVLLAAGAAIPLAFLEGTPPAWTVASDPTQRGPEAFTRGTAEYTYDERTFQIDLYIPTGGGRRPVVILLPSGAAGGPPNHVGHAEHLASWGYIVALPYGFGFLSPSDAPENAARASAVLDSVLASQAGKASDRIAIVGTHYNGASAMRATISDPRFRAIVGLHPDLMPWTSSGSRNMRVPYLILGGNVEGGILCPLSRAWQELYFNSTSAHKATYFFNLARPADFGEPPYDELGDFCGGPRATPFPWIRGLMTAWLEYYLKGNTAFYELLYQSNGLPKPAPETSDSEAANAPQGLLAEPLADGGARLHWTVVMSDTTVLAGYRLYRSEANAPFAMLADVPLTDSWYDDRSLSAGVSYRYTMAYRDRAGHLFQTAEPVSVVGGAPTFTPTPSASPTRTPRPTATATPIRSPTATRTASPSRTATRTRTPDPRYTSTPSATPTRPEGLEAWAYLPFCGQSVVLGEP